MQAVGNYAAHGWSSVILTKPVLCCLQAGEGGNMVELVVEIRDGAVTLVTASCPALVRLVDYDAIAAGFGAAWGTREVDGVGPAAILEALTRASKALVHAQKIKTEEGGTHAEDAI